MPPTVNPLAVIDGEVVGRGIGFAVATSFVCSRSILVQCCGELSLCLLRLLMLVCLRVVNVCDQVMVVPG